MNMIPRTMQEVNEIIAEKVSLEDRMKSVYVPVILTECACTLIEEKVLSELRVQKRDSTKKLYREINNTIISYRKTILSVTRKDLYDSVINKSKQFYTVVNTDIYIRLLSYYQCLLNGKYNTKSMGNTVSLCYVIREILRYIIEYDKEFARHINSLLGGLVTVQYNDDRHCVELIKLLTELIQLLGFPTNYIQIVPTHHIRYLKIKCNR